jgi:tetrahydromethanopterin S-methyltransferase subunit G
MSSSSSSSLEERNEQMLSNISNLQKQEQALYTELDDPSLSTEDKERIVRQINEISQLRINLYTTMKDMYSNYTTSLKQADANQHNQMAMLKLVEKELNESKKRLNALKTKKTNLIRKAEISTYYGEQYSSHIAILKNVIIACILCIVVNILPIPVNATIFLTGIVVVIAVVKVAAQIIDISNRNNMVYDEYDFYFNKSTAPDIDAGFSVENNTNPWEMNLPSTCIGSACCSDGQVYDTNKNKCI